MAPLLLKDLQERYKLSVSDMLQARFQAVVAETLAYLGRLDVVRRNMIDFVSLILKHKI